MKEQGIKIRMLREIMGHNQKEMSKLLGISQPLYSNLENGNRRLTEKNMIKLCELFGIETETFKQNTTEELLNELFRMSRNMFIEHIDLQGNEYLLTLNKRS